MRLRWTTSLFLAVVLVAAAALSGSAANAGPAVPAPKVAKAPFGTQIKLARAVFDPTLGAPSVPSGLAVAPTKAGLWLVQVKVPVTRDGLTVLGRTGLTFLGVVPDATYVARGNITAASLASRLPAVRAVVPLQPGFKLRPELDRIKGATLLQVGTFPDSPAAAVAGRLRTAGIHVVRVESTRVITVRADRAQLAAIAADDGVTAVSLAPKYELQNTAARWTVQSARRGYTPLADHGLDGTGEVAAVADTGLDYYPDANGAASWYFSDCTDPLHPTTQTCKKADHTYQAASSGDLTTGTSAKGPGGHRKVVAYFNEVGPADGGNGDTGPSTHGTHVSGSVAGNRPPYAATDSYDGQAPQGKLVFQDIGTDGESLAGLPGDLFELFAQAYDVGSKTPVPYQRGVTPRVHSNSWGSFIPAVSLGNSPRADDFVTTYEDMAIIVAAGNGGPDTASVGEPGTAKNVITSGAMAGGDDDFASLDTMANFSSHGEPGRIKPDVATPGLRIVSPKGGSNTDVQVMQGTSMSTPTLAGDALLVRQYFEDGFGPSGARTDGRLFGFADGVSGGGGFNPSAALVKAVLVNSGQRMRGQYTGTQGSQRNMDGQWPSNGQGWGRVQLDRTLYLNDVPRSPNL
ncbi:MAG: hypothetical protein JWO68_2392, partial [Actinomycetia bacterium]|nr:hypothetical protein [Actinomycetes bacterium]